MSTWSMICLVVEQYYVNGDSFYSAVYLFSKWKASKLSLPVYTIWSMWWNILVKWGSGVLTQKKVLLFSVGLNPNIWLILWKTVDPKCWTSLKKKWTTLFPAVSLSTTFIVYSKFYDYTNQIKFLVILVLHCCKISWLKRYRWCLVVCIEF